MKTLAKLLYGANAVTCIFIGVMHTVAHYADLKTENIKTLLNHKIPVSGTEAYIWDLWQGMSLMMGFLLIVIGILHLSIIQRIKKAEYPPISGSLIMIFMLVGVIYAGVNFFDKWQVYGGIFGILVQSTCLVLTIAKR